MPTITGAIPNTSSLSPNPGLATAVATPVAGSTPSGVTPLAVPPRRPGKTLLSCIVLASFLGTPTLLALLLALVILLYGGNKRSWYKTVSSKQQAKWPKTDLPPLANSTPSVQTPQPLITPNETHSQNTV